MTCKCEHWQICPVCYPQAFDADGNRKPPEPTPLQAARQKVETLESAGHRLALELECLLMDCKDNAIVSKWWDSAHEALHEWQQLFPYNGPRLGD